MTPGYIRHLGYFAVLLLVQVLILNNVRLGGYINPYVYVLFVLLLPVDIKGWALLLSAFFGGLAIDMFMDTLGMHTAATLFMAFCRPGVIRMISVKADFEKGTIPSISNMSLGWIMIYSLLLIFLHHTFLFFLEIFSFSEFWQTLSRITLSSLFTFILVILGYLFLDNSLSKKR